jgi:hypothetical protein
MTKYRRTKGENASEGQGWHPPFLIANRKELMIISQSNQLDKFDTAGEIKFL